MSLFNDYGGTVTIIMGLSLFLGKVWANRLHEKDKMKNEQEILQLKDKLEKNKTKIEHFHQISQTTYQKLFETKINIYQQLIDLKSEYTKHFKEGNDIKNIKYDPDISYSTYYDFILKTIEIINKNKLYISNELFNRYSLLYKKTKPNIDKIIRIQWESEYTHKYDIHKYKTEQYEIKIDSIRHTMLQETRNELDLFFNQIENDIKQIRNKIALEN